MLHWQKRGLPKGLKPVALRHPFPVENRVPMPNVLTMPPGTLTNWGIFYTFRGA
jgi:hypothetical protein